MYGSINYLLIVIALACLIILDLSTIGRHIAVLKANLTNDRTELRKQAKERKELLKAKEKQKEKKKPKTVINTNDYLQKLAEARAKKETSTSGGNGAEFSVIDETRQDSHAETERTPVMELSATESDDEDQRVGRESTASLNPENQSEGSKTRQVQSEGSKTGQVQSEGSKTGQSQSDDSQERQDQSEGSKTEQHQSDSSNVGEDKSAEGKTADDKLYEDQRESSRL